MVQHAGIFLFTIRDFTALCKKKTLKIERRVIMNDKLSSKILTGIRIPRGLGAERIIAVVSKTLKLESLCPYFQ